MFLILLSGFLILVVLGSIAAALITRDPAPLIATAIAGIVLAFMSFTIVDARSVGIQTSLGKYADTLKPGFQIIAPWSSVEEFTTRMQKVDLKGEDAVKVTFKGGGSGQVEANVQYQINSKASTGGTDGVDGVDDESRAQELWKDYRSFDDDVKPFVEGRIRDAVLNTANDFTPNDARVSQDIVAEKVKAVLNADLARYGIVTQVVSILEVPLDAKTQASLDKIVAAQNDIDRAAAEKTRAEIDVKTAKLREQGGALTPEANQRYCLDVVNSWDIAKNGPLPATMNCALTGAGQAGVLVSVPQAATK